MKKSILTTLFAFLTLSSIHSQTIFSFTVVPANPTIADTVTIIIGCEFPYGSCDGQATISGMSGDKIYAEGLHCMGLLTVICTDYDTVSIPPLSAGQYSFIFTLNTGSGANCDPSGIPPDVDSIQFTVTGLNEIKSISDLDFDIFSNPGSGSITILNNGYVNNSIRIYSINGKLVRTLKPESNNAKMNVPLETGIYIIEVSNEAARKVKRIAVVD